MKCSAALIARLKLCRVKFSAVQAYLHKPLFNLRSTPIIRRFALKLLLTEKTYGMVDNCNARDWYCPIHTEEATHWATSLPIQAPGHPFHAS